MDNGDRCDGCDKLVSDWDVTLCRIDYPDDDWETFRFCPECVAKDDAARPI